MYVPSLDWPNVTNVDTTTNGTICSPTNINYTLVETGWILEPATNETYFTFYPIGVTLTAPGDFLNFTDPKLPGTHMLIRLTIYF